MQTSQIVEREEGRETREEFDVEKIYRMIEGKYIDLDESEFFLFKHKLRCVESFNYEDRRR